MPCRQYAIVMINSIIYVNIGQPIFQSFFEGKSPHLKLNENAIKHEIVRDTNIHTIQVEI